MRGVKREQRGQALVEFALVFPVALLVIFGIIVCGLLIFYQQQLTNVAREAARFASIHSSTALCPTSSWRDPQAPPTTYSEYPFHCDGPNRPGDPHSWPEMTKHARAHAWGLDRGAIWVNACWSGYAPYGTLINPGQDYSAANGFPRSDNPPVNSSGNGNVFAPCTIDRVDPENNEGSLGCRSRMTTPADDPASNAPGNQVTLYACFQWTPPLSSFLFMPSTITMRAVVTEVIQRQQ